MAYLAIPTLLGQAALAAAVAGEAPLDLARMVIGDGNGNPTTPFETQANLVNLRATLPLQEVSRKPEAPHRVNVDAIIDENTGGWTIREAGLVDSNGRLLFVASVPATEKRTTADNVEDQLTLGVYIVVSAAANITIAIDEATWATQGFVETLIENWRVPLGQFLRVPFIAVDAIQSNPPSAPAVGATFLIGDNASGAWVGMDGRLVQWRGDKDWSFAIAPLGTTICVGSTGVYWKRISTGWRRITADNEEHLAGTSTVLFATPAGVKAMIGNRFPANKAGALVNDGAGNFSWEERLPIRTLDTKASAASADRIPVYDPVLKDNRTVTISQVSAILADADEMHLEIMFQGML